MTVNRIEDLYNEFPEFKDDLDIILYSLQQKMNNNTLEDLMIKLKQLVQIGGVKRIAIRSQKYEDAAYLRDEEKKIIESIGAGLNPLKFESKADKADLEKFKDSLLFLNKILSSDTSLALYIRPGTASPKQIGEFLAELSTLYRMIGGSGIEFRLDNIKSPEYTV